MGRRSKAKRKTPVQLVHSLFKMPPPDFYHHPILHLDCGGRIEVEGCKSVMRYDKDQICLDMGGIQVALYGDGLILEALNGRELQIRGQVLRAEFSYE